MERIYTNLLSNAFKFTPEKGIVKVVLKRTIIEMIESVIFTFVPGQSYARYCPNIILITLQSMMELDQKNGTRFMRLFQ